MPAPNRSFGSLLHGRWAFVSLVMVLIFNPRLCKFRPVPWSIHCLPRRFRLGLGFIRCHLQRCRLEPLSTHSSRHKYHLVLSSIGSMSGFPFKASLITLGSKQTPTLITINPMAGHQITFLATVILNLECVPSLQCLLICVITAPDYAARWVDLEFLIVMITAVKRT